jgi:uncharacterized protein
MLAMAQDNDLDRGATSVAPGTQRTCALTRKLMSADEMVRFVVGPGAEVVPDVKRKLPGRGIWITATRAAIEEAIRRNIFARGFKRQVRIARDLAAQTEQLIGRAALDALAMAGKAGTVVSGFSRVEDVVGRDDILALIHATDAGDDGKRKLMATLRRNRAGESRKIVVIEAFTGTQLDLALNRPNVVHAALLAGPGSDTFLARATRLMRFRTGISPEAVSAHAPTDGA